MSTVMFCVAVLLLVAGLLVYSIAKLSFIAGCIQYFALVQASIAGQTKQMEKSREN